MSIDPKLLQQRLKQIGAKAAAQAVRDSMREDAPEVLPSAGPQFEAPRGFPNELLRRIDETMKTINRIDSGIGNVTVLADNIVRDANAMYAPGLVAHRVLRIYQVQPENTGEFVKLVLSDRNEPMGLWETHHKGQSVFRLELLRRTADPALCKRVLERDRDSLDKLSTSMGLPRCVAEWLSWRPKNKNAWKIEASKLFLL